MKKLLKLTLVLSLTLLLSACSTKAQKEFNEALKLQQNQKYDDAINLYKDIIDNHPKSKLVANSDVKLHECIDLIVKQGDELASKKNYIKAISCYQNASKFKPTDDSIKNKISACKKLAIDTFKKDEPKLVETKSIEPKEIKITNFNNNSKISQMIVNWESAWESQDINVYRNYYDTDFVGTVKGKTMDYTQWMNYKEELFNKYSNITLASKLIDATLTKDKITVRFEQWFTGYGSSHYSDHSNKELIFRYSKDRGWLIISEKTRM
ncbi:MULTISPECIES: L,D-transpeptidase Cds6 family protein [Clostridium]|uniref:L,D-transpeptidase Cds6 family protein n=1 Tax=Clostridium TaxID=1485 RepID=UPI0004DAC7CD|nr:MULTISPECIES: hypothetical protein [Clostridium]KEH89920.1 hypothetical protein Z967_04125 [Clostridium novyi A str. 4540]KEH95174.1 hypothetical protein Z963_03665 [Clostridium botulinum C/D str. It1]